ncbi:MAG: hypothetical protein Q8R26_00910 [bacterium]|nr:hypothetical protein [bacterium]
MKKYLTVFFVGAMIFNVITVTVNAEKIDSRKDTKGGCPMIEIEERWKFAEEADAKFKRIQKVLEIIKNRSQKLFSESLHITFKPSRALDLSVGLVDFGGWSLKAGGFFGKEVLGVSDITDQWFVRDARIRSIVREELERHLPDLKIKLIEY